MPTKFVLRKRGSKYSFEMIAGNGAAIAKSVGYASKRTALNAIRSIQTAVKSIEDATEKPASVKRVAKPPSVKRSAPKRTPVRAATTAGKPAAKRTSAKRAARRAPLTSMLKKPVRKAAAPKRSTQPRSAAVASRSRVASRPRPAATRAATTRTKALARAR